MALYWQNETSGVLARIVRKFFNEQGELTFEEIFELKKYIRMWINDKMFILTDEHRQGLNQELEKIRTKQELQNYIYNLNDNWNIDPF